MPRVVRETVVRAPPERVYASLTEPAQRAQWLTSMTESHAAGSGPLAVGSRVAARRKAAGSKSSYEITVTRLQPPRLVETSIRRNGEDAGRGGYELISASDGTHVRAFADYQLPFLARMMAPLVSANLEKELDADLASLKRHVEGASG